jgi:hypothetical protein
MRRLLTLLSVLIGSILSTVGMTGQPTSAQTSSVLSGTVTTSAGALASGVQVEALTSGTTTIVASTSTNPSGVYSLSVAPATYDLRITTPVVGSTPATQIVVAGVVVAGSATTRNIAMAVVLPSVTGRLTVNGQPGTPYGAGNVLSYSIGGGTWTSGSLLSLRSAPGSGGSFVNIQLSNQGTFSAAVIPGTYELILTTSLLEVGFNPPRGQIELKRRLTGLVVNSSIALGDINFSLVDHTLNLLNADGSQGSGFVEVVKTPTGAAGTSIDEYVSTFRSPISGSRTVPLASYGSTVTVSPSEYNPSVLASVAVTPTQGGSTNITVGTLPTIQGHATVNSLLPHTLPGVGDKYGGTLPGALPRHFYSVAGFTWWGNFNEFSLVPASGSPIRIPLLDDGSYRSSVPAGVYTLELTFQLYLWGNPLPERTIELTTRRTVTIPSNGGLGNIDFSLVNHTIEIQKADGTSGAAFVRIGKSAPASGNSGAAPIDERSSTFSGPITGSLIVPLVSVGSTGRLFPESQGAVGTSIGSSDFVPSEGGSTVIVIAPQPVVTGRVTINGAQLYSEYRNNSGIRFGGETWTGYSSVVFTPSASGSPVFIEADGTGRFSLTVAPGTYSMTLTTGLLTGSPRRTLRLTRRIPSVTISSDRNFGDINFTLVNHTIALVNADGSAGTGTVSIDKTPPPIPVFGPGVPFNPNANVSTILDEYTSLFSAEAVVGSVVAPLVSIGSTLTVSAASGAQLAKAIFTPNAGGRSTVVFGSSTNIVVGSGDNDGDNIADDVEAQAPNHDANGDGVDDHTQANVASIPAGVQAAGSPSTAYVSVAVPAGLTLTNVQALPVPTGAAAPPAGTSLPEGLVKFVIPAVTPAADVTIRIYSSATNLTGYAKLFNGVWSQMPANRVTIGSGWVDVRITDNGIGDDDPVLGRISDPGAVIRGESNLPRTQPLGGPTTTTTLITTTTTSVVTTTTTSVVASVPTVVSATPLSFAPIENPVSTTSPVATVTTTLGATQPTAATQGATTTLATIPAAVLVQATPIPPAPGPAQAGEAEPAFTGSNSIPLTLAGGLFVLLGYLMFWATSHRGKSTLKRLANRKKLDSFE